MSFRILGYSESRKRVRNPQFPKVDGRLSKELAKKLTRTPKPQEIEGRSMSNELVLSVEKELKKVMDDIFKDMQDIQHYAGTAYCIEAEDEAEAKFWKGQYIALRRTRQNIQNRMFMLQIKREEKEELTPREPK